MASSPLKLLSTPKRPRLSTDWNKCIICQVETKERLVNSTSKGTSTLQAAASKRQDIVYTRIEREEANLSGVKYHKSCISSYTSKTNLSALSKSDETACEAKPTTSRVRRSLDTTTDWKKCIVCQKVSKKVSLHKIETNARETSLRISAEQRSDDVMIRRITGEDLIALEAVYHNKCMASYVSKHHISRQAKESLSKTEYESDDEDDYEECRSDEKKAEYAEAFKCLVKHIQEDLLRGKVFEMSSLLEIFMSYLQDKKTDKCIYTHHLQRKLKQHFGDGIVIHPQRGQGKSSLVMNADITVLDAVKVAGNFKKRLSDANSELGGYGDVSCAEEETFQQKLNIIHHAVSILRQEISEIQVSDDYPLANDLSLDSSANFVPKLLYQTMLWLIDKDAYTSATPDHIPRDDAKRRALSLAECAIYANRKVCTPLHLGLATQMHHDYGKKGIIEILHALGFSVGYDELRRFTTTLAQEEMEKVQSGNFIPKGIIKRSEGGALIHEGDDNIDINTETIDGKNTFHSMARVVFQDKSAANVAVSDRRKLTKKRGKALHVSNDEAGGLSSVLFYEKPKQRPEPPKRNNPVAMIESCKKKESGLRDLSWVLLRQVSRAILPIPEVGEGLQHQSIPFWTGYNAHLAEAADSKTTTAYRPMIDAPPADMSTVYTTMVQCKEMTKQLGQECAVQTMDQQLYAVAQQVKWSRSDEFDAHVLRLGGFHTLSCFTAAIGKLWGGGGLRDMLVDSGVYAACTADQMLSGKQFNRSVRGLTLAYESLMHCFIQALLQWCNANNKAISDRVFEALGQAHAFSKSETNVRQLESTLQQDFVPLMNDFKAWGSSSSPTFEYWLHFLDAVEVLLLNMRAERQGDWAGNLDSLARMLPYFFVTQRVNYSRWLPVYLLDMLELPDSVQSAFKEGQFTVKNSSGRFNGLWSDMGTETTVIRDAKGDGGIIGLTRKEGAMARWSLTRHLLGEIAYAVRERSGIRVPCNPSTHEQAQPSKMKQDEEHVQGMVLHINENMTNPFDVDSHPGGVLINIATGLHATKEVQKSLLTAVTTGKIKMEAFLKKSLSTDGDNSFYSPISRSGLVTFTDMTRKTKVSTKGVKINVTISPEMVFRRALTMSRNRNDVSMDTVLSHPITPIPISLFHEDGTLRKCQKSELVKMIEEQVKAENDIPAGQSSSTVYIRDAMAEVQMMQGNKYKTFAELGNAYLEKLMRELQRADTVIDVFDRYDCAESVKECERERRQASQASVCRQYHVLPGRAVPQWRKFLNLPENKASLANFISEYVATHGPKHHMLANYEKRKILMAGGYIDGQIVKSISSSGALDVEELFSTQEEADTRILLHAMSSDAKFKTSGQQGRVIIKTPDTDVIVLAIHYMPKMHFTDEMWIETGRITSTIDRRRYIPVHSICQTYGEGLCQILPPAHALSGCDSVSCLFGIGKKTVMKSLIDKGFEYFKGLNDLAGTDERKAVDGARKLISHLYDAKRKHHQHHNNLNALRVRLANTKEASLLKLPPCESSFLQHVKRASWQTKAWLSSHTAKPNLPSPNGHGWHAEDGKLVPVYSEGPAAAELLQGLLCTCRSRAMCSNDCECNQNGLPCTDICPCLTEECNNPWTSITTNRNDAD